MKLLVVAQGLHPYSGGSAESEASLCAEMSKRYGAVVLCRQGAIDYSFTRLHGIQSIREYYPSEISEAWLKQNHWLHDILKGIELVHLNGHWRWEDHFFARHCVRRGIPFVLQPRGMLLVGHRRVFLKRVYNQLIGNWLVRHASRVIALSRFEVKQFAPYAIDPARVRVIPNGISSSVVPSRGAVPPEMQSLADSPYYLYYGRLEQRKNLLFLIDVFARYLREGGKSRLYLMGPVEREYDKQLQKRIVELRVGGQVQLLPPNYAPERWFLVANARAILYPTIQEPYGRVPFEAISVGSLPVVPDESGSAEYLRPFMPQLIYRYQDPRSLCEVLARLDGTSDTERSRLLAPARSWVSSFLSWSNIGNELSRVYEELVPSKSVPCASESYGTYSS